MKEATVETRGLESPYQTVVKFGESGPRIHFFWRGDADDDCHDHPSDFWTFPLTSYVEEYRDREGRLRRRVVKAFGLHRRRAEFTHRLLGSHDGKYHPLSIMEWAAGFDREPIVGIRPVVTLVWWGKKRREWGFHTPKGWEFWRSYLGLGEAQP